MSTDLTSTSTKTASTALTSKLTMFITSILQTLKGLFPDQADTIDTGNMYSLNCWPRKPKIQFILKQRDTNYTNEDGSYSYGTLESGLYNSANFVCEMLNESGCDAEIIQVVDNNSIDREVTRFRPDIVVIEALWVVPEKFEILNKLHPTVTWVIRNHSKIPFLANEGIAMDWALRYLSYPNVMFSSNAKSTNDEMIDMAFATYPDFNEGPGVLALPYLPNYYPIDKFSYPSSKIPNPDVVDIGCFGAVRPLKNQLLQAVAAIQFAEDFDKTLNFHINSVRLENNGGPVLSNLRGLFSKTKHKLVEHEWMKHADFLALIQKMDVCMQVSYTETFNIVSADITSQGVPVVTSDEIEWSNSELRADPNSARSIYNKLCHAYFKGRQEHLAHQNYVNINKHNDETKKIWLEFIENTVF
jgi:glycosyltransferase involved in cell wall biosynthesis